MPLAYAGVGYTCTELLNGLTDAGAICTLFAPRLNGPVPNRFAIRTVIPGKPFPFRLLGRPARWAVEQAMLAAIDRDGPGEAIAYVWPGASERLLHRLRDRRIPIVRELINCFDGLGLSVLDAAYDRAGLPRGHRITVATVEADRRLLALADLVFASNVAAEASLAEAGIARSKILPTSFGWRADGYGAVPAARDATDEPMFLFVGDVCVRKGAHLLLDYWARAQVKGRLVLAGRIEPALAQLCAPLLARPEVSAPGYVADMSALYRAADVFVFPSLEEGGPQVTYEAAGCGLPLLVSPMGAGRVARDERNGLIREPYDADGWIVTLRRLAADVNERRRFGEAAREDAQAFTWDKVGARRHAQLAAALASRARQGDISPAPV